MALALAGGPVAAVVAVPVMVLAAIGSDTSVVLLAAIATAGRRRGGVCALAVRGVADPVRGGPGVGGGRAQRAWRRTSGPALDHGGGADRALRRDPERVSRPGVPRARRGQLGRAGAGAAARPRRRRRAVTGAVLLDSGLRVMQGDGSVLNPLLQRRWPCAVTGARPS